MIRSARDIDTAQPEGKLLIAAIHLLQNATPDLKGATTEQVIENLQIAADALAN